MMTTISSSFVMIDGQRYSYVAGSFVQSLQLVELNNIQANRAESPFIDAQVGDFSGGITPDDLANAGTTISDALGMMPDSVSGYTPFNRLSIGRAIVQNYDAAGAGPFGVAVKQYRGNLYAGEWNSDSVYVSADGVSFTLSVDLGATTGGVTALEEYKGSLYASKAQSGEVQSFDGSIWGVQFDLGPTDGVYVMQAAYDGANQLLYAVADNQQVGRPTYHAIVYSWNGSSLTGAGVPQAYLEERYCRAGLAIGSTLYLCGNETQGQIHGTVYTLSGTNLAVVGRMLSNYAVSMQDYQGDIYMGATNGELYVLTGGNIELVRKFPTSRWIWSLTVKDDALWIPIYNDTIGAPRIELWRYDGKKKSWSMPSYVVATNSYTGGIASFNDRLHIGAGMDAGGASRRRMYAVSATQYCTQSWITSPYVTYGVPTMKKRFVSGVLEHSALVAGQQIVVYYDANDGTGFHSTLTNKRVGSTRTVAPIPDGVPRTGKLAYSWVFNNLSNQPFSCTAFDIQALPAPDARYVWEANLLLTPRDDGRWPFDNSPDYLGSFTKLRALEALRKNLQPFQFVGPFYDDTADPHIPLVASLAVIDMQTEISVQLSQPGGGMEDALATVPIRILQAGHPVNLLSNASFEIDAIGTSPPTDWFIIGDSGSGVDVSSVGGVFEGTKAARIRFDGVSWAYGFTQILNDLVAGRWYTLSVYLRRVAIVGGGTFWADVSNASGSIIYAHTPELNAYDDATYLRYATSFVLPATTGGTVYVRFLGLNTPGASAPGSALFVDGAFFGEVVPTPDFVEMGQ